MPREVGDDKAAPRQERRHRLEVPGRPAVPVDQQERRPETAFEDPDPRSTALVEARVEALEKIRRIRHPDRLFSVHYEWHGDKAGRVKLPVLRPKELET